VTLPLHLFIFLKPKEEPMALQVGETYKGSVYRVTRVSRDIVHMEDTGMVSAGDKRRYEYISGVAELRIAQTVLAMDYLKRQGFTVAFKWPVNPTTIACAYGEMVKLEWATRARLIGSYRERHPDVVEGAYPVGLVHELFSKLSLDIGRYDPRWWDGNKLYEYLKPLDEEERATLEKCIYHDPYLLPVPGKPVWEVYDAHAPVEPESCLFRTKPVLPRKMLAKNWDVAAGAFGAMKRGIEMVDCGALGEPGLKSVEMVDWKIEFTKDGLIGDVVNLDTMRLLKNGQLGKENQISKQVFRDGGSHEQVLEAYQLGLRIFEQLPR
jgi:phosphoribosylaminoimidazole-succinocarboxamide synthase